MVRHYGTPDAACTIFFKLLHKEIIFFVPSSARAVSLSQMMSFHEDMFEIMTAHADPATGLLSLEDFIQNALYNPTLGYYSQTDRKRVGRNEKADFYTNSSLGAVFSSLVLESVQTLLPIDLREATFVELGPESETGVLGDLQTPFKAVQLVRPNQAFALPPLCVVFSNEVFDAQPFRRFAFDGHHWLEGFVQPSRRAHRDPEYKWKFSGPSKPLPNLPTAAPVDYIIDWPSGAIHLIEHIAAQTWNGLFLAIDYGLPLTTLLNQRPRGTARAYKAHQLLENILAEPGCRDITCHIAWDPLQSVLADHGFTSIQLERQEAFFMRRARSTIESIATAQTQAFSRDRMTLMEILHPDNLGSRFQILSATR